MIKEICKIVFVTISALSGGRVFAMEVQVKLDSKEKIVEKKNVSKVLQGTLEKLVIVRERADIPLYQIESEEQKGAECGLYAVGNSVRMMAYLDTFIGKAQAPTLHNDVNEIEYQEYHGYDWDESFFAFDSEARKFIIKKRLIASGNDKKPASVRDIMQAFMLQQLADNPLPGDPAADSDWDKSIMRSVLNGTLLALEPKEVGYTFDDKSSGKNYFKWSVDHLAWSIDKEDFIRRFREVSAEQAQKVASTNRPDDNPLYKARLAKINGAIQDKWLEKIFNAKFVTSFKFYPTDTVGKRVLEKVNLGEWPGNDELMDLINAFDLKKISIVGTKNTFEEDLSYRKRYHELDPTAGQGSLAEIIDFYERTNYGSLLDLKLRMQQSKDDIVEAILIRLSSRKAASKPSSTGLWNSFLGLVGVKTTENSSDNSTIGLASRDAMESYDDKESAHWVSLVVCRLNGAVRYYIADSYKNQNIVHNLLVNDVITFLNDGESRKESLFYIDPSYRELIAKKGDQFSFEGFIAQEKELSSTRTENQPAAGTTFMKPKVYTPQPNNRVIPVKADKPTKTNEPVVAQQQTTSATKDDQTVTPLSWSSSLKLTPTKLLFGTFLAGLSLFSYYKYRLAQRMKAKKDDKKKDDSATTGVKDTVKDKEEEPVPPLETAEVS